MPAQKWASASLLVTDGKRGIYSWAGKKREGTLDGQKPWIWNCSPEQSSMPTPLQEYRYIMTTQESSRAGGQEEVTTHKPIESSREFMSY